METHPVIFIVNQPYYKLEVDGEGGVAYTFQVVKRHF